MKFVIISFSLLFIVLFGGLASADYYYSPMNFDEPTNHTFEVNMPGNIDVILPTDFTLVGGSSSGINNVSFTMTSPNMTSDKPELYVGTIWVDGAKYEDYYLLGVDDSKIVDTKVEIGHGDFNYIDPDGFIGTDNTLLFNLVRVWAMGSDIIGEPATDVRFNCTYPLIIPNTVDSKYTTEYSATNITAEGELSRMEGISMFRIFVFSQEVEYPENSSYEVSCDKLYYDFPHTQVVADISGFNLSVRNTNPLKINMVNNSEYVTYTILNDELYDLRNLEFVWTIGTNTLRQEFDSLEAGEVVQYNIPTNESGEISLQARFIPEWMFNSRSPSYYEQSTFDTYFTPSYLDGLNISEYFNNQTPLKTPILETQVMDFSISILQNPPLGGAYKIEYSFFDEDGVLRDSVVRQIIGVEDHIISISSSDLNPVGLQEEFDVYTTVSIMSDGDWYSFPQEFIGVQSVATLTDNGARSQIGLYDVIVTTQDSRYEDDDNIVADILIKNTGDTPDEDTVLTYYLIGPDGEEFGNTKEQILEVPVGATTMTRSITLPLGAIKGEWEFHADYETVVQPLIKVHDSFELVEDNGNSLSLLSSGNFNSKYIWASLTALILLILFLVIGLSGRRKRK